MPALGLRVSVTVSALLVAVSCSHPEAESPATRTDDSHALTPASSSTSSASCLGQGDGWCTSAPCVLPDGGNDHPPCCAGLVEVESFDSFMLEKRGQCLASKGGRANCVACGDGRCERGENKCNCPRDCGSP